MPALYESPGIRFQYPESWTLHGPSEVQSPLEITLDAPTGGFWSLHAFPADASAVDLGEKVLQTLREQYQWLEVEPVAEHLGDYPVSGFDAEFYCLDFLVSAKIRVARTRHFTFVCLYQAESRDFDRYEEVFRAITTSLLTEDRRETRV